MEPHMIENFKKLSETEKKIMNLRFGLNGSCECTQEETGQILGMHKFMIRRIERIAIQKLIKKDDL